MKNTKERGIIILPDINPYDRLRLELFEIFLPRLIYNGSRKERDEVLCAMRNDGAQFVHSLFKEICQEDKIVCRYKKRDFKARCVVKGGITMAEVELPEHETKLNNILRVYLLFVEKDGEAQFRKYFVIKRFADGRTHILHVDENGEGFLGEDLTPSLGDKEHEYWRLANAYAGMILQS